MMMDWFHTPWPGLATNILLPLSICLVVKIQGIHLSSSPTKLYAKLSVSPHFLLPKDSCLWISLIIS